tara:strand:- start:246 stop:1004 length:759 start_codon:yes stop_codon:yes gene_type:complete
MLKKRVIPLLLYKDGRMVKGKKFKDYKEIGMPSTCIRVYSAQDADELMFINIDTNPSQDNSFYRTIEKASEECFMPLTCGGNIYEQKDAEKLIECGADKVLLTTSAFTNLKLINRLAAKYGSQSIVCGIDYRKTPSRELYINKGEKKVDIEIIEYAKRLESNGAGEILVTCIDCDGMMDGYDLLLLEELASSIKIPVIASGGSGTMAHLKDLFEKTDVAAAACGSIFNFGDNNPIRVRSYLRNHNIPVRILK